MDTTSGERFIRNRPTLFRGGSSGVEQSRMLFVPVIGLLELASVWDT